MKHVAQLPSLSGGIVPLREKIREAMRPVNVGDTIEFQVPVGERIQFYRALVEENGLQCASVGPSSLLFERPVRLERWEYAFRMVGLDPNSFPDSWRCLDVGCGPNPWPRANVVVDTNVDFAKNVRPGQVFVPASITQSTRLQDKEFDFVTCFHVLEHVNDPVAAAAELSRIGKQGLVEVPHPAKDGMLLFHETDHRWFIMPPTKKGGPLLFHRIDSEWWKRLHDSEAIGAAYRTYVAGQALVGDSAILRNYFARVEPYLNTVVHWTNQLLVEVVG